MGFGLPQAVKHLVFVAICSYNGGILLENFMLTTDVRCRIDAKTKAEAAVVIEAMGLNISDAIRMFLKRVATDGAIPFDLRTPNKKTIMAIKELESPKSKTKLKKYKTAKALHEDLLR
jgi:DNA-damage-inducible protein J